MLLAAIILLIIISINFIVIFSTQEQVLEKEDYLKLKNVDCIIVLGAGVRNNKPSPLLEDRLSKGVELYQQGIAPKIIMSGDHGGENYDEVNVMKQYAIEQGIPSEDIFMDHAGFSTYESIYRAKEIFGIKKVVIVTQEYHLYRALYIANRLGLESYGVKAQPKKYTGATYRELREVLARNKDVIQCIFKPKPSYLGEEIPINGNGNVTNDK